VTTALPDIPAGSIGAVPPDELALAAPQAKLPAKPRSFLRRLLRSATFVAGSVILLWWVICAVFGPQIAPYDPVATSFLGVNHPPDAAHWFGTDQLGRDVLSRVIVGAREILEIAPLATLLGTVAGTALGLVMGYFGGAVDVVLGRLVDAVLSLPLVIVAFLFIVALGPTTLTLIVVIGAVFTPLIGRTVRAAVLGERNLEYVATAQLRGEKAPYVMFAEILPNVLGPVIVEFTVRLGYAIFTVATLSFLGFGVRPPTPDWGYDISQNYVELLAGYWWETLFPALAIASLVVGVNLINDGIEAVASS
jgi:peptide/nickel transport system permease protein